jgi:glyoxylase-like metal-dependent hydrolase (beta-lactamase superfamily II)
VIELGGARCHVINDGRFALDGGAMFGVVPRVLWERNDPPDARNRVTLALNLTLIEANGRRVLVDTGLGAGWSEKERGQYGIESCGGLAAGLGALGLGPEDVDVVVNTHLHFDHCGGNLREQAGRRVPAFPRARYVIQRGEWEDASHPHERNRGSYRADCFLPLAESGQLELVDGEAELAPGVRVVPVGGHTAHHQMVIVQGERRTLCVPTDLLPTASHLPLAWVTGFDLHPVASLEAKRRLLAQAAAERWWLVFYHDPRRPVATVREAEGRYVLDEVVE